MPAPKRRRWFSLSLRTLLIGMTLISGLFGWFLHYRREKIAERERLLKEYPRSINYISGPVQLEFCDSLLGWELPAIRYEAIQEPGFGIRMVDDWASLRAIASPRLRSMDILRQGIPSPPDRLAKLAQSLPRLFLHDLDERLVPQFLSSKTRELRLDASITDLSRAPYLRDLVCGYPITTASEFEAILTHPRLQKVEFPAEAKDLALFGSGAVSTLGGLSIRFDWQDASVKTTDGPYAWVQRCTALNELEATEPDPAFLAAVGCELGGVESLTLTEFDAAAIDQLAWWKRLRHLRLEQMDCLDDRLLASVSGIHADVESLEINAAFTADENTNLTASGLTILKQFPHLKRLRLDYCKLTKEHILVLAELKQLEELSLDFNSLDDEAIAPLHILQRLRVISLDDDEVKVSEEAFRTIRANLSRPPFFTWPTEGRPYVTQIIPVVGAWSLR